MDFFYQDVNFFINISVSEDFLSDQLAKKVFRVL